MPRLGTLCHFSFSDTLSNTVGISLRHSLYSICAQTVDIVLTDPSPTVSCRIREADQRPAALPRALPVTAGRARCWLIRSIGHRAPGAPASKVYGTNGTDMRQMGIDEEGVTSFDSGGPARY